jgi:hypothetical protein
MIGAANRATGAREKHRAAPEALTVSLDAGGNRVSGLRTLDHDHTHVALLEIAFLLSLAEKHRPVGVRLVSVRVLGGHRAPCQIEHRAVGLMLATGLIPTGRIPPQTNLGRELSGLVSLLGGEPL